MSPLYLIGVDIFITIRYALLMNKLIEYDYDGKPVRSIIIDGNIHFRLSDVGLVLGLSNPYQYSFIKKGGKTVTTLTNGGNQDIMYIDETLLYRLIMRSKKIEAIKFQDWVFEKVLPSIRKTGSYTIPRKLIEESKEKRKGLTDAWKENGVDKPFEYAQLTIEEYNQLEFPKGLRKPEMTKEQLIELSAFESLERLNLMYNPKEGFFECKESLKVSANAIKQVKRIKEKNNVKLD